MASFEPFVSSDPFSMSTFNSKLGGAFDAVDKNVGDVATVANNALEVAQKAGVTITNIYNNPTPAIYDYDATHPEIVGAKMLFITAKNTAGAIVTCPPIINGVETTSLIVGQTTGDFLSGTLRVCATTGTCTINWETGKITINNFANAVIPSTATGAGNAGFGVMRIDILK